MSGENFLLLFQNIGHFLLECKVFLFVLIFHCSFHCTHVVFDLLLSFFFFFQSLSGDLILDIDLFHNLIFLVLFFRTITIFRSINRLFYWCWSNTFLIFLFLPHILFFGLLFPRFIFPNLLFFRLLFLNICSWICTFRQIRRNFVLRSYHSFLIIARSTIIGYWLNRFRCAIILFLFFNILGRIYFLDLLSGDLDFVGIILPIFLDHFIVHLV